MPRLRPPRYDVPHHVAAQLRRRLWRRRGLIFGLIALLAASLADRFGCTHYRGDDWEHYDKQSVEVIRVVDGDTVRVRRPDASEDTVRLLGIDAPEHNAHFGSESTAHLKEILEHHTVIVRLDATDTRDKYGRLLAYLNSSDSEHVNLSLVRDGYAYAHRMYPHALKRQFEQAEDEARNKKRGLWVELREDQQPAWRQKWLAEKRQGG